MLSSLASIDKEWKCLYRRRGHWKLRLDILEMNVSTSEPTKELVNRDQLIFRRYQVDVKKIMCPFQWWEKHKSMFPTMGFLAHQILGIMGSQIETKRIFSLVDILINLKTCVLSKNLGKLKFVSKN